MTSTNDGKDVKSNQTSGPKGKSYYIELYKSLEARLSEGSDAHERTRHLCVAWRSVHSLCQQSAPSTHAHLLNWLQRHTARTVLQTEWQTPKRKDDRKCLEEAIDAFIGDVAETSGAGGSLSWQEQLVARGEWFKRILDNPWGHPVLTLLLNPNGTPPTDDEVLAWLTEERGVTFVVRLHTLVGEKCDDIAVSLAAAVMERARAALPPVADAEEQTEAPPVESGAPTFADRLKEEAGFTLDVWEMITDIEFVLLHKRDSKRCITLAKQTPLLNAYPLIERLQKRLELSPREKRLWKNAREVAILIAQVVIARCMVVRSCGGAVRTALYCCARLLARLLAARLPAAADALAAQAPTARHLHTLAQAVDKQLSSSNEEMKPYVCELYVRAITAGMNELERLKLKTEKETEARTMEKTLASWFVQLGTVLARSDRIACECTLTAFSLHPSQKMYERIDAAPPLAPVLAEANESKEESVKSEFGSWANDSRAQTNLVKTSETLNMKQTQNQANVLSTAIFNEGEALGLSPELCQDIAVLLSGPRVKTLSWDMDRTRLLENCRAYCEVTHEGTRALTRELKYLNIDPQQYQHLPEEKDDDENDPYYGIERGYEHLAVLEEPEEIWEDADDIEKTESASSIEVDYLVPRRKKKTKRIHTSDEDSDPLSFMAETKRTQKKKERPHSKERSKERKKKQDLVDPLDINVPQNQSQTKAKKEPKEKKERKKKEKVPKVIGGKRSALASLVGIKVGKSKMKPKDIITFATPGTDSDYDSQGKNSLTSLNSEGNDPDAIYEESILSVKGKSQELKTYSGTMKNQYRPAYNMFGNKGAPSHVLERPQNSLSKMQYKPQAPGYNRTMTDNYRNYNDVRANLATLLDYRQREVQQKMLHQSKTPNTAPRKPAIMRPDIQLQSNISPKSVTIPEIPKSYINKEQAEKLAELMRAQSKAISKDSVIQFARKNNLDKMSAAASPSELRNRAQQPHASSMKMSDLINPSYDRLMAEIAEKHRAGQAQGNLKAAHSQYQPAYTQKPVQRSLNVMTSGQRDFQNFLKEYEHNKYLASTQALDMSKSAKEVKKPVMPISKVIPVLPNAPKPEPKPVQHPKQPVQKKSEHSLNTFSRLSYHKNKQNEMKNKMQTPKPACTTTTYQDVSSELDEIIKEHQREQMKVIQSKRVMKPAIVQEPVNKCDFSSFKGHPILSNMLQNTVPTTNSTFYRNDLYKSNPMQHVLPAPQKTLLSEKDDIQMRNLLWQKNKLNSSHHHLTNIQLKPSVSKAPPVTCYNTNPNQTHQQPAKPSPDTKSFPSSLESKIINVISNTLLKPGHHEVSKSISVRVKSQLNMSTTQPAAPNYTAAHDTAEKSFASNDHIKKNIPGSSKPEWQSVMSDLLKHKTPTRGPNALDVALNKSSFESAFEKSLKEATTFSPSQAEMEKDTMPKHQEKADRPKPVIGSIQNVIITKKGIKLQNEVPKQQKDLSVGPKAYSKQPVITNNEKLIKKVPQEVQRKQFIYAGSKNADPFISGIPNSDYDLLEELMDDDLRKEIGELSSDEESYNVAAQSFLKPTKSTEKRVGVQFSKSDPVLKPTTNVRCLNERQSTSETLRSVTPKPVSQCANKIAQTPLECNSLKTQYEEINKIRDSNCMASTNQSDQTHISTTLNSQNEAYNNIKTLTNRQVMIEPNVYISAVPQQVPLQNVVLVGQELVYGGFTSIQTSVQSMNNVAPNAYVALNTQPTMTLYQTTQYTAPVVIGTSITVPVINNVSSTGITAPLSVISNVAQPSNPALTVEPQTSVADTEISIKTCDTHTDIKKQDRVTDCCPQNHKLQEETKASERKVLSEVQEFAMAENIDKTRNQKIENNVNIKKDTVTDTERLKNKRLAIINREIYHQCGEKTIPLTYYSLTKKIETVIEKHDFSKDISLSHNSASPKEDKQKLSDSEEEKLLAQIKNNLRDLSDAINDAPSPATPDSNDSKENKTYSPLPCRRILLRSSNKITSKPSVERMVLESPTLKKSKAKLKSDVSEATAVAKNIDRNDKTAEKETSAPKRASKRLRNKKITVTTDEKKPLQHQREKPDAKAKPACSTKNKSKVQTETEKIEHLDFETELQGIKISKSAVETKNKLENECNKLVDFDIDATISEDKPNENITEVSVLQNTDLSKQSSQKTSEHAVQENDVILKVSLPQKTNISEQTSQKTAFPEDEERQDSVLEASVFQKNSLSDKSSEKFAILANQENKDLLSLEISLPQKTSLSELSCQNEVNQSIPETIEHRKRVEKYVPVHITDKKETKAAVKTAIEKTNNKVFSETKEYADNNSESRTNNDNTVCSKVFTAPSNEHKNNVTTTNIGESKLPFHLKDPRMDRSLTVSSTGVLITNCERSAENLDTSDNKMTHDANKGSFPEKDGVDLDMTVTCEEVTKPRLGPTFGSIKTARNKPINLEKKNDVKICDDIVIVNNDIKTNQKPKENSLDIEKVEKSKPYIENVDVEPIPKSWLVNETPQKTSESEVPNTPHCEMPTNNTADTGDVVVIDDDTDIEKPVQPLIESGDGTATVEMYASNKAPVLQNEFGIPIVQSVTSQVEDEALLVKDGKDEAIPTNVFSGNSDKKPQREAKNKVDPSLGDVNTLSEIPQHFKDQIQIKHLPSNNPMKQRVRVTLPNGRKVIATVHGMVHVTFDTLFAYPSIKEALLNGMHCKQLYTMNIEQIATVDKSDPRKILKIESRILKIETPASTVVTAKPVETIDLLSDDENTSPPQIVKTNKVKRNKQVFITEYGKFTAPSMDKNMFTNHQNKFNLKSRILLKKVDSNPDSQTNNIQSDTPKKSEITGEVPIKYVTQSQKKIVQSDTRHENPNQYVTDLIHDIENTQKITQGDIPMIPTQLVTGLINDIENKLSSEVSNTPIVIPEVVEIEDSSNDSLYQGKSTETITEDNTISNLKNVLLKELRVEAQKQTATNVTAKETQAPRNGNRRKVLRLSDIPTGKSCPFDDLDEEDQLQIFKRKCAIKLARCDAVIEKIGGEVMDALTQPLAQIHGEEPITITEDFSIFNDLDDKVVETEERSSSPVIELLDVLVSLDHQSLGHSTSAVYQATPMSCEAIWHNTKSQLHLQNVDNTAIVCSKDCKNYTNICTPSLIDQANPLSCEANWFMTKGMLRLQCDIVLVRSRAFEDICDDIMVQEVAPLPFETNWQTTKAMPHLQRDNDITLEGSNVFGKFLATPLPSETNWQTTKTMPHLQGDDDITSERSDVFEEYQAISASCEAIWVTTKTMLHLQMCNDAALEQSHILEHDDKMSDDSSIDNVMPLFCEANWCTTKPTLHLEIVNDNELLRSDDAVCDDSSIDKTMPLSCEANWCTTKPTLHLEFANDNELLEPIDPGYDDEMCDNSLIDKTIPISCEAYWLFTKRSVRVHRNNYTPLAHSNLSRYDNEMCDGSLSEKEITPYCEANWLTTKPMLHLLGVNDAALVQSKVCKYVKICNDGSGHKNIPLSCEANWLTTKSTLHVQGVNDALARFNSTDLDIKISRKNNCVLPLSCEARWFTTKTMLHLDAESNALLMKCSVSTDGDEKRDISSTFSEVVNVTEIIQTNFAPSLVSLVLKCLQDTNVTKQYRLLHKANTPSYINLLKRKISALQTSADCKVRKLNETTTFFDCNISPTVAFHNSISELVSGHILQETKVVSYSESNSDDKTVTGKAICATECNDNRNLDFHGDDKNRVSETYCKINDYIDAVDRNANKHKVDENYALSQAVDIIHENSDELLVGSNSEYRFPSVIGTAHLIAVKNDTSIQFGTHNSYSAQPISPTTTAGRLSEENTKSSSCNKPTLETKKILDKKEDINDSDDSTKTSDIIHEDIDEILGDNPSDCDDVQPLSPVIGIAHLIAFENDTSIQFDTQNSHDTQPVSPTTTAEQLSEKNTKSSSFNNDNEPTLETGNILDEQEDISDFSDCSTICSSPKSKNSGIGSLKTECSIASSTNEIEPHSNVYSNDCNDIEEKLAEIFSESSPPTLSASIDADDTKSYQNANTVKISDSEKSDIIRIIFVDKTYANTDNQNIEMSVGDEEEIDCCEDSEITVGEYSVTTEHQYYASLGAASVLGSVDKTCKDNHEVIYVSTEDVMFLSENESNKDIEEEIVDMRSDEIVDDFLYDTTTNENLNESDSGKLSDQVSGSVNQPTKELEEVVDMRSNDIVNDSLYDTTTNENLRENDFGKLSDQVSGSVKQEPTLFTTTDECIQVVIKENHDDALRKHKEQKCQKADVNCIETCAVAIKDAVKIEENTTKLCNDVSGERLVEKYLALIRNKSKVLESVVEYEDPEAGTCYVIPVIQDSSHSDIESNESTEVVTSIIDGSEIGKNKSKIVGTGSRRKNNKSSQSKESNKHKGVSYDDIEARLAEIVGESFSENESMEALAHTMRLDEKYETSYSVEIEAISNPEQDLEDIARQLSGTDDQDSQKITATSLASKSISGASKKRRSKYHNTSKCVSNIADTKTLKVKLPKHTYGKGPEQIKTRGKSLKRKLDMSDTKTSERKYRKGKNIDYPKFTAAALSETVYAKEYKSLIDYCSSIKFSFAVPFHKEQIDVHNMLKSWPIQNSHPEPIEQPIEANEHLFAEMEKSEALLDPLELTLAEEIISKFDENSYTPSSIHEINFNMGFGERSGRVIQKSEDGEYTTFSAATLSDVKQLQPLLPSDEKETIMRTSCVDNNSHDQKLKAIRFVDHLNIREKVRSFFEKTKAELALDWKCHKKDFFENENMSDWPFGDLTSTRFIQPSPVEVTANVVQVGQLPVSAAAQNPVTCDPRVTHVSNASPSQCSPENSLGDELQTPIKTEYTELTTADITLPLMQEYVQHHSMPSESQEPSNMYGANDSTAVSTQIKSVVKIELMEETSQDDDDDNMDYNNGLQQLSNGNVSNSVQYQYENNANNVAESDNIAATNSSHTLKTTAKFSENKQINDAVEKPDQLAHAMNAAGISGTKGSIDIMTQNAQSNVVTASQVTTNSYSKGTPINAIALQQALAQILPPPLNQTNTSETNSQTSTNPQVLHIVQGNNAQSVINKPNGTQLLHIVQNKNAANTNGTPVSQQNTFSGLSLVDGAIQQSGNQLLHIVNTANQKSTNAGQLLKRVNLLTNLANVQGSNEQKMVQFVCKSADGKSIQLPHQRSMVLRLQPMDSSNVPTTPKQNDNQDHSLSSATTHSVTEKESNTQEMKSRSLYEENYAKFVQNDGKFAQNGDSKSDLEKATSLPKFNQVFGKQVYQDKQNEMDSENLPDNADPPEENNSPLEPMNDITNPPMLLRKSNPTQPSHVQPNLVQQIKQSIGPMNIQTMHGGVIYTRQIPVNIGNGQTINLITVPSTELVDDSAQKQQTDAKFGNQEGDPPIIKIVPTNQSATTPNGSTDDNSTQIRSTNETNPQPNPQPQPVLTQMRIKLPMLSKAPQMVGGTRVVRPSFFQIQRNVFGGANQQVYQQLVLTAAPPLGQSIRLPAQVQKPKTTSDTQSSPESQMSSSTLEQLREFDMVLEQVKERSTVQPGSSTSSTNNFTKMKSSPDATDSPTPSTSTQESPTQVLYSVGNTQPLNMVNYVNRKSTITSTTTTSFVRSPDSTATVESPSSSTHSHLPHTVTSDSCASSSCASEAAAATATQPKPKKKKPKPSSSNSNPFNIKNTPKPSSQKPLEDEQTTQRILYILAEYKEQVENSPDKDKPAPRRRNNPAAPSSGSSKRKKSSSGSRRRDMSPVLGEDSCRTMGSEDSSCGTSLGECNECVETQSPEESPKKVVRRLTFEQETQVTQTRTTTTTTTTTVPQRNVIVTDGQAFAVRGATGKPATTVLMPANYLLPVSMVKGGQQIAIVTNRGPKLLVGAGEGGTGGTLLFQRLIGPGALKPVLARPGVRHIRLPATALHNLQAFNIATPAAATSVQPPDSTASPAPAPTPPDLVDTRAMSSPWPDRDAGEVKPERGNSSPEGSEPWNLPSSSIADDYGYEEIVRTDNMDRTVLETVSDRFSPDLEAQRIFDKMFDDSKKCMYDSRCGYDIDASDDDKAYHQVVHRRDGRHTTRLTHVSAAALRHKYAILEHELRLQKSLSEECEDLGVDSPSASELFPEAELLFAPSPAHEQTIDQCHTPQPTIHTQGIPQPDLDDQIATDHLLIHKERHDDLDINLDDVGEIVTVGEDGMTTIPLDHEEFARSHEEFARSHPNTTFHSEPEDGEVPPFTIAQGIKGRQITFHTRGVPATVVMAPQTTVISQATVEASGTQNPVKYSDIDNMINVMPSQQHVHINMPSVLKESNESIKFDRLLNESRELNLSNAASAIVHSTGNGTQVIRRVHYERRDSRYLVEEDAMIAGDPKTDERRDIMDDTSSSERHPELFWDTQPRPERKRFDFSSDSEKCCKSPYDETNSDSSGIGVHTRLDSVIKAARTERSRSDGSSAEESHPPLRTYPAKRTHQHTHHSHHHDVDRSLTGKTRASDRCHDVKDESRRRASNRGVVKRGCHCCNGSTPPKPKKSRPKKTSDYEHN